MTHGVAGSMYLRCFCAVAGAVDHSIRILNPQQKVYVSKDKRKVRTTATDGLAYPSSFRRRRRGRNGLIQCSGKEVRAPVWRAFVSSRPVFSTERSSEEANPTRPSKTKVSVLPPTYVRRRGVQLQLGAEQTSQHCACTGVIWEHQVAANPADHCPVPSFYYITHALGVNFELTANRCTRCGKRLEPCGLCWCCPLHICQASATRGYLVHQNTNTSHDDRKVGLVHRQPCSMYPMIGGLRSARSKL